MLSDLHSLKASVGVSSHAVEGPSPAGSIPPWTDPIQRGADRRSARDSDNKCGPHTSFLPAAEAKISTVTPGESKTLPAPFSMSRSALLDCWTHFDASVKKRKWKMSTALWE
jgi:hypothetical protein